MIWDLFITIAPLVPAGAGISGWTLQHYAYVFQGKKPHYVMK